MQSDGLNISDGIISAFGKKHSVKNNNKFLKTRATDMRTPTSVKSLN